EDAEAAIIAAGAGGEVGCAAWHVGRLNGVTADGQAGQVADGAGRAAGDGIAVEGGDGIVPGVQDGEGDGALVHFAGRSDVARGDGGAEGGQLAVIRGVGGERDAGGDGRVGAVRSNGEGAVAGVGAGGEVGVGRGGDVGGLDVVASRGQPRQVETHAG